MPCFLTSAMKSSGANCASADLQKCGFSEMKWSWSVTVFVKLHRPPPEIRIFSPIFRFRSSTRTDLPRLPASIAHMSPAAPAPSIMTSGKEPSYLQAFQAVGKVFEHLFQRVSIFYTPTGATKKPDFRITNQEILPPPLLIN